MNAQLRGIDSTPLNPMHIVLVPASFFPRVGGLETAVARLAGEYMRRGHQVTVVTNRYPRILSSYEQVNGIPVYRVLTPNLLPDRERWSRLAKYLVGIAIAPFQIVRLARLIAELEPNIMNIHYLGTTAVYAALARSINRTCPLVVSVHGSDLTVPCPTGNSTLSVRVATSAQALTACSNDVAVYLKMMLGNMRAGEVVVTGNGVDPTEFESVPPFEHTRPYLFTAARFTEKKGLDVLVRALRDLVDANFDIDLILAGSGPAEPMLREITHQLRLERHVHFWGLADRQNMAALMKGCRLFVLPSLREGFGIVCLEAMVCGKAVVASRTGGIPEVVRDNETGKLVVPGDVDALSQGIASLLSDPSHLQALGKCGRDVAMNEFTWEAVANRYLHAYSMVMEI